MENKPIMNLRKKRRLTKVIGLLSEVHHSPPCQQRERPEDRGLFPLPDAVVMPAQDGVRYTPDDRSEPQTASRVQICPGQRYDG